MPVNSNNDVYGTSRYIGPHQGAKLLAEAEYQPTCGPCGCCPITSTCCTCLKCSCNCGCFGSCVLHGIPCLGCCGSERKKYRTFARVYENRLEVNDPSAPCCCCSKEKCIVDEGYVFFYDKLPNRAGMCCYCIPCICCGPPVIWNHIPRCCCSIIDCRPCCGESIIVAPCNCFNLKFYLCCGTPCYQMCTCCQIPLVQKVANGEDFLGKWKTALDKFYDKHGMDTSQKAIFRRVADRCCNCDSVRKVPSGAVVPLVMDRDGNIVPYEEDKGDEGAAKNAIARSSSNNNINIVVNATPISSANYHREASNSNIESEPEATELYHDEEIDEEKEGLRGVSFGSDQAGAEGEGGEKKKKKSSSGGKKKKKKKKKEAKVSGDTEDAYKRSQESTRNGLGESNIDSDGEIDVGENLKLD